MTDHVTKINILDDDLSDFQGDGPAFVTFGETMIRDTPIDLQRPESAHQVSISLAGSEFTLAFLLARFGIPTAYVTRIPDNPYGWLLRDSARSQGITTDFIVWADKTELMGRFIYEIGRTPRKNRGWYQRKYSAASRLGAGEVDWACALEDCLLFHTSGISFGLSTHSGYEKNYLLEAFEEAMEFRPSECMVGCDFNYRSTLWNRDECVSVMTPILENHVDVLITTIEDMAELYGLGCGQYAAEDIVKGEMRDLKDEDIQAFASEVLDKFQAEIVAITIRYPDSFEEHRWESAAVNERGDFYRSAEVRPIRLYDRLGGGDTWNGGFYYGLLTGGTGKAGLEKGVRVGDAATRIKQTLMFDLPYVNKWEVQDLIRVDTYGGGKRTAR